MASLWRKLPSIWKDSPKLPVLWPKEQAIRAALLAALIACNEEKSMYIAHVGAYKKFSDADRARWTACCTWIAINTTLKFRKPPICDIINLIYKRDFLKKTGQYDIVVVHSILDFGYPAWEERTETLTSPDHSIEKWHERLIQAQAKLIFICEGQPITMSGWKLGEIEGYVIKRRDQFLTVYERYDSLLQL
jgi:hypothetical protein